jgi:isochorismate synthase
LQKEHSIFFSEIQKIFEAKLPFVIYRKPGEIQVRAYIQNDAQLYNLDDFNTAGFVFAPFHNEEAKIVFPESKSRRIWTNITNVGGLTLQEPKSNLTQISNPQEIKEKHLNLVKEGLAFIKEGQAKKIVLSWKEVLRIDNFDMLNTFKKMLMNYENAFVYLWFHPEVGMWMGASPERLLHIKNNLLKSMALAGTQLFEGSEKVIWNEKEIKEQEFVTDFLLDQLTGSVSSIKVSKPYTAKAGSLLHIRTDISGTLDSDKTLKDLIDALHPTPAVCGLPKDVATNFILNKEGYHRDYYSGYLGELNVDHTTNLYVNLRCMKLKNNEASIYVGGGITIDSNPDEEWAETLSKTGVMRKVL